MPLPGPQCEHQRQGQLWSCGGEQTRNVGLRPDLVGAIGGIESPAALARIGRNSTSILGEGEHAGKRRPGIIGFSRGRRHAIAPALELAAHARTFKGAERHIAKLSFDFTQIGHIGAPRRGREDRVFRRALEFTNEREQAPLWRSLPRRVRLAKGLQEFSRSGFALNTRSAPPCVTIDSHAAVNKSHLDRVNAFKMYAHRGVPSTHRTGLQC